MVKTFMLDDEHEPTTTTVFTELKNRASEHVDIRNMTIAQQVTLHAE